MIINFFFVTVYSHGINVRMFPFYAFLAIVYGAVRATPRKDYDNSIYPEGIPRYDTRL